MTVRELIENLQAFPDDMRVVVDGYEAGYDDLSPEKLILIRIALNVRDEGWAGPHDDADDTPAAASPATVVDALVLRRTSDFGRSSPGT